MANTDPHVTLSALQKKIREYLGLDADHLIFEFDQKDNKTRLNLITINPRHKQSFLFHTTFGLDKADAAEKMWAYIQTHREKENSYTIQWRSKDDKEVQTSYFRAVNMYDALDKLYYNRDMNTITIYSMVLNPVS